MLLPIFHIAVLNPTNPVQWYPKKIALENSVNETQYKETHLHQSILSRIMDVGLSQSVREFWWGKQQIYYRSLRRVKNLLSLCGKYSKNKRAFQIPSLGECVDVLESVSFPCFARMEINALYLLPWRIILRYAYLYIHRPISVLKNRRFLGYLGQSIGEGQMYRV